MCIIENISDKFAKLKISEDLNVDMDSDETEIDENFEETVEFQENKINEDESMESKENKINEDVSMVSEGKEHNNELSLETLIELLDDIYPIIREHSAYWAPEVYKIKIKQYTGIDVDEVMHLFEQYHQEENKCETDRENLKRKFVEIIYPISNKKHCP